MAHKQKVVGAALVVGGGIAGVQAALDLADSGIKVYLLERSPAIGGKMAQLDKTFPTNDCAMCIISPKLVEAGRHINIDIIPSAELISLEGSAGNFVARIRRHPRFVDMEKCIACGTCAEKCPKKVDDPYNEGLGKRKAVYVEYAQAVPLKYVIDKENCIYFQKGKCRACEKFCPTGAINFEQEDTLLDIEIGNIVLATGYDLFDARRIPQYGYGRFPNVFTSLEFERMTNAAGPTDGKVVLRDGVSQPGSVAIVHCVGSRDKNYHEYCSRTCCMYALKYAHLVKDKVGHHAQVFNF